LNDAGNWSPAAVPDGAGVTVNYSGAANTTVILNTLGGFSVGTVSTGGSDNVQWNLSVTTSLTLNEDGAGSGYATINDSNTSTGNFNQLLFGQTAGNITLADDLLITNTGASTVANGSISIRNPITGTGNVTFSNVAHSVTDASTFAGGIRLQTTSANTFTGSVPVEKGAVVFANSTAFGNSANTITLGRSGSEARRCLR